LELHPRRVPLILIGIVFLAFGVFMYVGFAPFPGSIRRVLVCGLSLLLGGGLVAIGLRPFRFHIGVQGLTLRLAGINGLVSWAAIDAIVIEQPDPGRSSRNPAPWLLLVPAEGVDLDVPAPHRSPVDERACVELLTFNDVKESPEQVGQALALYGGSCFADARPRRGQRGGSRFTLALRGYDTAASTSWSGEAKRRCTQQAPPSGSPSRARSTARPSRSSHGGMTARRSTHS